MKTFALTGQMFCFIIKNLFDVIHYFNHDIKGTGCQLDEQMVSDSLPTQFTYPFHYTPHPLVVRAAEEVNAYLRTRTDWQEELSHGKMFGVLLVQAPDDTVGYLAAFSGNLAGSNQHAFFVPPVFDLLRPGDFFKVEEGNISAINQRIKELSASASYQALKDEVDAVRERAKTTLALAKKELKEQKRVRDGERKRISEQLAWLDNQEESPTHLADSLSSQQTQDNRSLVAGELKATSANLLTSNSLDSISSTKALDKESSSKDTNSVRTAYEIRLQEMVKESQFQKAEFKRLERKLKEEVEQKEASFHEVEEQILSLKQERKNRSAALQMKLFAHFQLLNANGETKNLCQIFEEVRHSVPPAGAGECALPKMLQYAYLHQLKPLAFGEFWWGESPKDEIRHHGQFYPSCKGKCEPILQHMLVGLEVESNPLAEDIYRDATLKILYEDEWMVAIDKPAGMLSTPGKEDVLSVSECLQKMYPDATGPLLVHRLDMATSGILLAAKHKETHAQLQSLFEAREVHKIYTAVLDGIPAAKEGCINLPLCLNPMDRPRQMVSYEHGKEAVTYYKVLATKDSRSLVQFDLQTGRTHQIRVHAAHPLGLNCPIKGDDLYGRHADRLYLHATEVAFIHPVTGKEVQLKSEVPFDL